MRFDELSEQAQARAYALYVAAMDDDANRNDILPMAEYGAAADWEDLEFDENGEAQ